MALIEAFYFDHLSSVSKTGVMAAISVQSNSDATRKGQKQLEELGREGQMLCKTVSAHFFRQANHKYRS
jgi:hypothetical protein